MRTKKNISAVIVAGGLGKRLGAAVPKAFITLGGRSLFEYSLEALSHYPSVVETVIVVPESALEQTERIVRKRKQVIPAVIVCGGEQRWESVRNGVAATASTSKLVLVHDAARPFLSSAVIDSLVQKSSTYRCVITATPVDDTIRCFEKDYCKGTVDRSQLIRVGTPQLFRRKMLIDAFVLAASMKNAPTDEAMLMEKCGVTVGFAWGDPLNFKITTPRDLLMAEAIIAQRTSDRQ